MQYEDLSGCLWTQHEDDDGFVYFFNASTQESAWELPTSARQVHLAPQNVAGAAAAAEASSLVPVQDASSCWMRVLDDSTKTTYFFNTYTQAANLGNIYFQYVGRELEVAGGAIPPYPCRYPTVSMEVSWELGTDDRLASGIFGADKGETEGSQVNSTVSRETQGSSSNWQRQGISEQAVVTDRYCQKTCYDAHYMKRFHPMKKRGVRACPIHREQVLCDFRVPPTVSEAVGRAGSAHVWPLTADNLPSRLERWDVLKAADPYRENFATGEGWRQEHPEFEPKLVFYAFDQPVEHAERYWIEEAEAPFRCRLKRKGLKFSRDITGWEARVTARSSSSNGVKNMASAEEAGDANTGSSDNDDIDVRGVGGRRRRDDATGCDGQVDPGSAPRRVGDGTGFYAFPLVVHNSHPHHVDWTSGPDRYQITTETEPEWGWMRKFTFFAYAASKYHVLETTESPLAQKVVKGNFLAPEPGWKCVLAFFAFDDDIPGSNRYYIEELTEPHLRTRVGMEASSRWEARHSFTAFDVPVPGSCSLDVHYTVRSADSLNPYPEQCRISLKDPWGPWEQKFRFYAFPAEQISLAPVEEDLGVSSVSLEDGVSSATNRG